MIRPAGAHTHTTDARLSIMTTIMANNKHSDPTSHRSPPTWLTATVAQLYWSMVFPAENTHTHTHTPDKLKHTQNTHVMCIQYIGKLWARAFISTSTNIIGRAHFVQSQTTLHAFTRTKPYNSFSAHKRTPAHSQNYTCRACNFEHTHFNTHWKEHTKHWWTQTFHRVATRTRKVLYSLHCQCSRELMARRGWWRLRWLAG